MSLYVVDASVAAKWYFSEEHTQAARRVLQQEHELHAPELFLLETDAELLGERMVTADRRFYEAMVGTPFGRYVLWVEDAE